MRYSSLHTQPDTQSSRSHFPDVAARLISDITNPVLVPTMFFLVLGYILSLSNTEIGWTTGLAFLFFTLLPFLSAMYLLHSGEIDSLDIPLQERRKKLFLLSMASTTLGGIFILLLVSGKDLMLAESAVVFLLNPFLGYLVNLRFKLSIHTAAIATAGTLFSILYWRMPELYGAAGLLSLLLLFVVIPAVTWSRSHLGVHSFFELLLGLVAGFGFTLFEIGILQTIW